MKTAISVPDATFEAVEREAASRGISRSEFYATAAARWLGELASEGLVRDIDAALDRVGDEAQGEAGRFGAVGARALATLTDADEW